MESNRAVIRRELEESLMRSSVSTGMYRPKQESPHLRDSSPSYHRQLISEVSLSVLLSDYFF